MSRPRPGQIGVHPIEQEDELNHQIARDPLDARTDLPASIKDLVMDTLQVDPSRQWASATEMADALAAIDCA